MRLILILIWQVFVIVPLGLQYYQNIILLDFLILWNGFLFAVLCKWSALWWQTKRKKVAETSF